METLVETNMRSLDRNWMSIWKMNALPKVKLIFGAFAKISFLIGSGVKVEEEIGLKLNVEDIVDLTAFLDSTTGCSVFPSGGGCDEELSIFLYRGRVDKEIITQPQVKRELTSNSNSGKTA
ncbi:hypothetical protein JHK85_047921 [Glycine max]|nr:hypothetical protein JHK86_047338 [Glycine max]KAG4943275.1 hypothetical protein JHK85_047921 [Glycine max]